MQELQIVCVLVFFLLFTRTPIHCHGKECSSDDKCSECYEWSEGMWHKISDYHLKLASQRETKKERKAKASSPFSSFFGFSPSMLVPLTCLSSSFDSSVVSKA